VSASGIPDRESASPLRALADQLEDVRTLDRPAKVVGESVRNAIPSGNFKDALRGSWFGHALHPLLTDVVIGSFTSASLLDFLGGDRDGRASERLIAIGIAAYGPTALTGVSDWADTEKDSDAVRRVGLVHAASNSIALSLYVASLLARRRGDRGKGKLLGAAGAAALGAAGYLGGHLTLAKGVRVEQMTPESAPPAA
jgi:uncharacterized membrane protein